MRRTIGRILVVSPFAVFALFSFSTIGFWKTLGVFAFTALTIAVIGLGLHLSQE